MDSIKDPFVKDALHGLIAAIREAYPGQLVSAYLTGSYREKTALAKSDIDGFLIFRPEALTPSLREHVLEMQTAFGEQIGLDFDLACISKTRALRRGLFVLKHRSHRLFGDEIRHLIQLPPMRFYRHEVWLSTLKYTQRVRHKPLAPQATPLTYPLKAPDPDGPFLGYTHMAALAPSEASKSSQPSTRPLLHCATRPAMAMAIAAGGTYTYSQQSDLALFVATQPSTWSAFLEQLFTFCRQEWSYEVPRHRHYQVVLKALCRSLLSFENHAYQTACQQMGSLLTRSATLPHWVAADEAPLYLPASRLGSLPSRERHGVTEYAVPDYLAAVALCFFGRVQVQDSAIHEAIYAQLHRKKRLHQHLARKAALVQEL